jgi:hypothetical protein
VGVARGGQAEQAGEVGLAGTRRQEVVGPHHLIDAGVGVVDDHGEVVGRNTVAATQHEVVDP